MLAHPRGQLGTEEVKCWVRQVQSGRKQIPVEQKGSFRWLEDFREACRLQDRFPEVEVRAARVCF